MEGFEGDFKYMEFSIYRHMLKSGLSGNVRPDPANVREKNCVRFVHSPRTPLDPSNFNMNYQKQFSWKTCFPNFTNKCLGQQSTLIIDNKKSDIDDKKSDNNDDKPDKTTDDMEVSWVICRIFIFAPTMFGGRASLYESQN